MKINEILAEAGFFKGLAKSIAPDAVNYRDQTKPLRSNTSYKSGEVNYKGSTYRWLGQQWGIQNPTTEKYQPAPGAIQKELNFLAQTQPTDQQKNPGGPLKNNNPGGVQIISSDPPMVRFEKKQYTIGDNGQWVPVGQRGSKAPPIQSALSTLFDKALGITRSAATTRASKPITVTTPNKINVTRGTNGRWIRSDDNTEVIDPREIKGLNQLAINQRVIMQKKQGA
jgi:hypothetical protein